MDNDFRVIRASRTLSLSNIHSTHKENTILFCNNSERFCEKVIIRMTSKGFLILKIIISQPMYTIYAKVDTSQELEAHHQRMVTGKT